MGSGAGAVGVGCSSGVAAAVSATSVVAAAVCKVINGIEPAGEGEVLLAI